MACLHDGRFAPRRALTHPLWWSALVVLVLNDHALKGSGWLPGAVTGKLSDVAGLMVAPVVLAVLAGVDGRAGLVAVHAAVGALFAAIQLHRPSAVALERLTEALGVPWSVVSDPTDLLALPALALSWWSIRRASRSTDRPGRCAPRAAALITGLWACAASGNPDGGERWTLVSDVYLHNGGPDDIVVLVRPLAPEILLDCDALDGESAGALGPELFAPGSAFLLLSYENRPFDDLWFSEDPWVDPGIPDTGACHAFMVGGDTLPDAIVFWRDGDVETEGLFNREKHLDRLSPGAIVMQFDEQGIGSWAPRDDGMVHVVGEDPPVLPASCAPQPDDRRVAFAGPPQVGATAIETVSAGADGCTRITSSESSWTFCMPLDLGFPFVVGDTIRVATAPANATTEVVQVDAVDPSTGDPLTDGASLLLARGPTLPSAFGIDFGAQTAPDCDDRGADDGCGTVARAATVVVVWRGGTAELGAGEPRLHVGTDEAEVDVAVAHAERRTVLLPACAEGEDTLSFDLEIAAVATARGGTP